MKIPKITFKNTERNRTIALAVFMIIALSAVSLWQRRGPEPKKVTFNSEKEMVASIAQSDPVANEQIMKDIVDEQFMADEIAKRFQVTQDVSLVKIPDSRLHSQVTTPDTVKAYFTEVMNLANDYNTATLPALRDFWRSTANETELNKAYTATQDLINILYSMDVPTEAFDFHKNTINLYMASSTIFLNGKAMQGDNVEAWPKIYKAYAMSELASQGIQTEYDHLKQKYNLPW